MTEYVTLKLPKEFIDRVRKFIEEHPELGYTSVPEFVKDAIRDHLRYLEQAEKEKEVTDGGVQD